MSLRAHRVSQRRLSRHRVHLWAQGRVQGHKVQFVATGVQRRVETGAGALGRFGVNISSVHELQDEEPVIQGWLVAVWSF